MIIKMVNDWVLVDPIQQEKIGNIYLPIYKDPELNLMRNATIGRVVLCNDYYYNDEGKLIRNRVKVGDMVYFGEHVGCNYYDKKSKKTFIAMRVGGIYYVFKKT